MAIINTGPNYTRTGHGFLTSLANKASFLPFIGGPIAGLVGFVDSLIEGAGWLLKGKPISAATAVVAGSVSAGVNAASGIFAPLEGVRFWVNGASGVATGRSIGTHARALTEGGLGMITGALGVRPQVLRSYPAGIGSVGGAQQGPGQFASAEAGRRGQDPQAAWNNYRNGAGADHVAALEASRAQGGQVGRA